MTEQAVVIEDVKTPEVTDNIIIPNPAKDLKALFSWLKANVSQDPTRPSLCAFYLDDSRIYWATNGYSMVRAELYDDEDAIVPPGHWFINECTTKLIHLIKAEANYPDVHSFYANPVCLEKNAIAVFDPGVFATVTKGFSRVIFHSERPRSAMHLVLEDPKAMPFGGYSAVLMPITSQDVEDKFERLGFFLVHPEVEEEQHA
jgi:hypothetical protein